MSVLAAFAVPHPPLIIPEVGGAQTEEVAETIKAYEAVAKEIHSLNPDTVVITSPHSVMYMDYFHISPGSSASGSFSRFNAPKVKFSTEYDQLLVDEISREARNSGIPAGTKGERDRSLDHATMIPLYFLKREMPDTQIVRIGLSGLSSLVHYRFGICIQKAAKRLGRRIVFIASGDLSHKLSSQGPYGFSSDGPVYDSMIRDIFSSGDFLRLLRIPEQFCESAAECGQKSFQIMAGALDGMAVDASLLSYECPFGVGYGIGRFMPLHPDDSRHLELELERSINDRMKQFRDNEDQFVHLARLAVETFVKSERRIAVPSGLGPELVNRMAGVFVSIHKDGNLRGCIGTIDATRASVAEEIISNGISAASRDNRFDPIRQGELDNLEYNVDVLGPHEKVTDKSQLDVKRYGVIVQNFHGRGLLLPDLAGVDTVDQQIAIARQKAGIDEGEPVELFRFQVTRHT
jgi:AmmeMemoRadiSam system protein A/AmmeMemoRadiSam system protein B